jgi:predicted unusual protein kinase regulating ubiquinone biosynthesis (AarF/ABC1/UbiB family)
MADDDHVQSGRLKRLSRLAYLTARTTGDLLAQSARRKLSGESSADLRKAAERILGTLGELKGAALKLGQALAMDPDALPPEARSIVAKLLSQAPQRMGFDQVVAIVKAELGGEPDALFRSFDRDPIAAASLGQVHAATLADGREVVVKVQYPGVDKALESDLSNAAVLVRGLSITAQALDRRIYYDELRSSLLRELDYQEEAQQCRAYAQAAIRYPELAVPEPISERSSGKVLTLTRLRGPTLLEAIESNPTGEERYRIGRLLTFAIWGPFFAARRIHADPHPGNFVVMEDGRLGVLDFGATKLLSEKFAATYRSFLVANANGRQRPEVGPALERAGFTFLADDVEDAYAFCDLLADIVERPIEKDEPYDFGSDPMVQDVRRLLLSQPGMALAIRPPAEAVLFYRSAAGLAQDLRLLKAKGRFRPILREIEDRGQIA